MTRSTTPPFREGLWFVPVAAEPVQISAREDKITGNLWFELDPNWGLGYVEYDGKRVTTYLDPSQYEGVEQCVRTRLVKAMEK